MLMVTMYVVDGQRATSVSVEELVETFQQILMEKMCAIASYTHHSCLHDLYLIFITDR